MAQPEFVIGNRLGRAQERIAQACAGFAEGISRNDNLRFTPNADMCSAAAHVRLGS
jgi:hypothetical protein